LHLRTLHERHAAHLHGTPDHSGGVAPLVFCTSARRGLQ
jgi:hypothetical protein